MSVTQQERKERLIQALTSSDDLSMIFPRPWSESRTNEDEEECRLTESGFDAMYALLCSHDYVDAKEILARMDANNLKGVFKELAKGAGRFIENHEEDSCIPSLEPEQLCLMMLLFALECECESGMRDADANVIH